MPPFLLVCFEACCVKLNAKWMSQKLKLVSVRQAVKVLK